MGNIRRGRVHNSLISLGRLLQGQLSVYCASAKTDFSVHQVAAQLQATNQNVLVAIYAADAVQIRALRLDWLLPGRLFCILDECIIDYAGTKHRAHAHIVLCENVMALELDSNDERLIKIRDCLYLLFIQRKEWPATPATN